MNLRGVVDQTERLIESAQRQARDLLAADSELEEPSAGALWEKATPKLEKALEVYNQKNSDNTPESSWVPGRKTKATCQSDLESILEAVLSVLETCGAAGYRTRIRQLLADNETSRTRLCKYRERVLSAATEESQTFIDGFVEPSKEALTDSIADEADRINKRDKQIEELKVAFREHLEIIGISVPPDAADSFLLPVVDDVVSMAAVISNIGRLTEQLQHLVDESREAPSQTKKYYGMYVLLVFAIDRIQTQVIETIDKQFLPRVASYEKKAGQHIADARSQISRGGPREQLEANIAANQRNIEACRVMTDTLLSHRRSILDENRKVQILEAAAVNTYRTVRLSFDIAELAGYCEAAFRALRELRLPPLRSFQNLQLEEELQRLAERVSGKE